MNFRVPFWLGLILVGCGGERGGPLTPPPSGSDRPTSVEVAPDSLRLNLGDFGHGTCTPRNEIGEALRDACDWASADSNVVAATTGTQSSRLTTLKPGNAWIIANAEGVSDSTRVTVLDTLVPPPPPPPPAPTSTCPGSGFLRLVFVGTASQLTAALSSARPGDQIRLADGVYQGRFIARTKGTATQPITVCGSPEAILRDNRGGYGLYLNRAEWWVFSGLSVTNGLKGVMADWSFDNVLDSLAVHNIVGECVHFRRHSSRNTIRRSHIHHCGEGDRNGEGVYVGSAQSNWNNYTRGEPDTARDNRVEGNYIHDTAAEGIEAKEATRRTLVTGNTVERTGRQQCALDGGDCASPGTKAAIATKGGDSMFECNDVRPPLGLRGFQVYSGGQAGDGDNNVFRWNLIVVLGSGPPIEIATRQTGNTQIENTPEAHAANCGASPGAELGSSEHREE